MLCAVHAAVCLSCVRWEVGVCGAMGMTIIVIPIGVVCGSMGMIVIPIGVGERRT